MTEHLYHVAAAPFEAARRVDLLPGVHPCHRVHGHSFVARVRALLPEGWGGFPGAETGALLKALKTCIAPLNYAFLNDQLDPPTDANLARWVRRRVDVSNVEFVRIQSTLDAGADLDQKDSIQMWRRFRFEAAHQLPNVPAGHKCGRMHGHGFEVILHARQAGGGWNREVHFDRLERCWALLHAELDYACLNDIPGLENPTSEILARWIWQRLKAEVPELSWVTVCETPTVGCHYDGTHYRIWKERRFESALHLIRTPERDRRRRLHGHSYQVRLHVSAPLSKVMGWIMDFGDVKALFQPIYQQLDHNPLNDLPALIDGDASSLARWIAHQLQEVLPELDRVDLYETPGCGVVLTLGAQSPAPLL